MDPAPKATSALNKLRIHTHVLIQLSEIPQWEKAQQIVIRALQDISVVLRGCQSPQGPAPQDSSACGVIISPILQVMTQQLVVRVPRAITAQKEHPIHLLVPQEHTTIALVGQNVTSVRQVISAQKTSPVTNRTTAPWDTIA